MLDFLANYMGGLAWTNAFQWPGATAFNAAPLGDWHVNGTGSVGGSFKSAAGLTFLQITNAGHMSPYDQPFELSQMLAQWLAGGLQ